MPENMQRRIFIEVPPKLGALLALLAAALAGGVLAYVGWRHADCLAWLLIGYLLGFLTAAFWCLSRRLLFGTTMLGPIPVHHVQIRNRSGKGYKIKKLNPATDRVPDPPSVPLEPLLGPGEDAVVQTSCLAQPCNWLGMTVHTTDGLGSSFRAVMQFERAAMVVSIVVTLEEHPQEPDKECLELCVSYVQDDGGEIHCDTVHGAPA